MVRHGLWNHMTSTGSDHLYVPAKSRLEIFVHLYHCAALKTPFHYLVNQVTTGPTHHQRPCEYSPELTMTNDTSTILLSTLFYATLVFSTGFLCGCIRVPILEPLLGPRYAQLIEMPIMMVLTRRCAILTINQVKDSPGRMESQFIHVAVGVLALVWLLAVEISMFVLLNPTKSWRDFLWERDPVAGTAFAGALVYMAVLPGALAGRKLEERW